MFIHPRLFFWVVSPNSMGHRFFVLPQLGSGAAPARRPLEDRGEVDFLGYPPVVKSGNGIVSVHNHHKWTVLMRKSIMKIMGDLLKHGDLLSIIG